MKLSFIMIVVNLVFFIVIELIDYKFDFELIVDKYSDEWKRLRLMLNILENSFLILIIIWIGILIICFICWCTNLPPRVE